MRLRRDHLELKLFGSWFQLHCLDLAAVLFQEQIRHERLRLGIISALAANESLTFNELKHLVKTTDGNLSVHARKLEDSGYVSCAKSFEGRTPKTEYRLTAAGRRALERYIDHMEALIGRMRNK